MDTVINSGANGLKELFHKDNIAYTITGIVIIFVLILVYVWFSTRVGYDPGKATNPVTINLYFATAPLNHPVSVISSPTSQTSVS